MLWRRLARWFGWIVRDERGLLGVGPALAATQAQMEAATATAVFATPAVLQYHPGVAKAWGFWDDTGTISASYNLTSVTDTTTGDHTAVIGTDFSSASWVPIMNVGTGSRLANALNLAAGTVRAFVVLSSTGAASDPGQWYFAGYGDQ